MKNIYVVLKNSAIIILASLALSIPLSFLPDSISTQSTSVIYTIIGILFSVGMSVAISFDLSDISNDRYYLSIKKDLKKTVISLIIGIGLATMVYIIPFQDLLTQLTTSPFLFFTPLSTLLLISAWMLYIFYALFEYKSDLSEHKRNSRK